ncbi:iron ABC transporter permease [Actinomycetospora endophytica]|uniref:Iron ABC transporter permease n=1 Tax=Actinomycetospora endophytica TaxID=2291215 RepID=A0ABS8PH78_9PSEU|nr:iron ABC transporter permease [Actinomycetospora endophytica]MCD2197592.1 iron ABC transporter permease [Actinomycetospora endophytica]
MTTRTAGHETRVPGRVPLRVGRFSTVWRLPPVVVVAVGAVGVVLAGAAVLTVGDYPVGFADVFAALVGASDRATAVIVLDLRLPEVLTGILVGAALSLAGALTQTIARNPLASPDITGITQGASAAALIAIVLGVPSGGLAGALVLPLAALVGGLGAGLLVVALAWRNGLESQRLVLVGVGVSFGLTAVVSYLLAVARIEQASQAKVWITGSLTGRGWEHVIPVGIALVVLVPTVLLASGGLGALQFGDDTARGLGVPVERARTTMLVMAAALAAVATAAAGPIEFVALVAPQVALRLTRSARPPLIASMVVGALLVVVADLVARTLLSGIGTPVGVVTAVLGGPFLLYLITRGRRETAR